jgi:hypothetical protein
MAAGLKNDFSSHHGHKTCALLTPNERKKKIEKMLETPRVMLKNLFLIRHL